MTVKELRSIIDGIDEGVEIACRVSSHGELDYSMLYGIEYNEEEEILEFSIAD